MIARVTNDICMTFLHNNQFTRTKDCTEEENAYVGESARYQQTSALLKPQQKVGQ